MATQTSAQLSSHEQKITAIVRKLPAERRMQLLAFARFLAFETFQTTDLDSLEDESDIEETYTEADERWDALLASEEGQLALDKLADQALADIRDGKASSMVFTADGEIAPR
jgi:hypothetical protein